LFEYKRRRRRRRRRRIQENKNFSDLDVCAAGDAHAGLNLEYQVPAAGKLRNSG